MKGNDDTTEEKKAVGSSAKKQGPLTKIMSKEFVLYCILAIAVALAAAFVESRMYFSSYSISVIMSTNTTVSYPYQTSYFTVNITNTGSASIGSLGVGFYLNGTAIRYSAVSLS